MLSLRSLARGAMPRALARSAPRMTSRSFAALHRPVVRSSLRPVTAQLPSLASARAAFTTGAARLQEATEGSTDQELAATLASELSLERDSMGADELPAELQDFLSTSGFEITDTPGDEEVVLTKQFGRETIKVTFSVADLTTEHDPDAFLPDRALQDEPLDEVDGADSKLGARAGHHGAVAGDESASAADPTAAAEAEEGADMVGDEAGFPVTMQVTVTKPGASEAALHFQVAAHDGAVGIERCALFRAAQQADADTAEAQWAGRNAYTGPPFGNLDEALQEVMERFLEERGIDTQLALWVPEYVEFKEQREYMAWLDETRAFIEA